MSDKMSDPASGYLVRVEGDQFAELFADCTTPEEVVALQAEIDALPPA